MTLTRTVAAVSSLLFSAAATHAAEVRQGPAAYGDWRTDAPGVARLITPQSMPPPFTTSSAGRGPSLVARPAGARLNVPPGFAVGEYASGLDQPRTLRVAPNGDVFLAESGADQIRVFRTINDAARPPQSSIF